MKVSFVRSGGFGGLRLAAELDTENLPPDEAAELRSLVAALDTGASAATPAGGADRFRYDLTIEADGRTRRLSLSDGDLTAATRPLVARLEKQAKQRN